MPTTPAADTGIASATPAGKRHPRLGHLLETSVYVADIDRAQAFYQRVFGFELFLRDERMAGLSIPCTSILLLFLRGGSTEPTPTDGGGDIPPHDGGGSVHLCFAIPLGEVAAWEAHLRAEAVTVESRVSWPRGGTSLYLRDPDDSLVELATPGMWPSW